MHWLEQDPTEDATTPKDPGWSECDTCKGRGSLQFGGEDPPACSECNGFGLIEVPPEKTKDPAMDDPIYHIEEATGQLFFQSGETRTIVGDIDLAVMWTTDEDGNGCLHKHGSVELVSKKMTAIRSVDPSVKMLIIPWVAISHPEIGSAVIEEVNKCLSISGYVSRLEEKLAEINGASKAGEDISPSA